MDGKDEKRWFQNIMRYDKDVMGLSWDLRFMRMTKQVINVKITDDELGKTLSLSDGETLISIPLETIDILKLQRGNSNG